MRTQESHERGVGFAPPSRRRRIRTGKGRGGARILGATALALTLFTAPAAAQGGEGGAGVVTGRVSSADDGEALSGVQVRVVETEQGVLTDERGRYLIRGVPAGTLRIRAVSMGYRTATRTVEVPAGGSAEADFSLELRPVEVGGIQVSVLRPDMQPQAELTERQVREANPKDAGQLLRSLPGLDAGRRGALGLEPVVRGLRETEVGTYLDGTRLFPAGPARMDSPLTHLDPSAVQDIQVVKGPYALTWGAGNLGAIRVETAPLPGPGARGPRGSIHAGYDTNLQAAETYGSLAARTGRVSYRVHGAWRRGGDYETGSGEVIEGDFDSWEGRGKVGVDVGENSRLSLSAGYQDQGPIDYPGRLLTASFFEARNLKVAWNTERSEGLLRTLEIQAYRNDVDHGMDNSGKPTRRVMEGRTPPFSLNVDVESEMDVTGGRAAADLRSGPWSVHLGTDLYSAYRNATRTIARRQDDFPMGPPAGTVLFDNLLWPEATITDLGAFVRASRQVAGVRLAGTLRLDRVWAVADTASREFLDYLSDTGQATDMEDAETNVSAAVTAGIDLGSSWTVSLGLGSAVRTADATERYSDHLQATKVQTSAEFMGTPELDPERSNQADLWIEGRYPDAAFQLNLFGRRVVDYITIAPTDREKRLPLPIFPTEVLRYVNGEATFWGGESSVTVGLTDVLTAEFGGSYLWGRETVVREDGTEVDEPAFGIAPLQGRAGIRYEERQGRYFAEATLRAVAEQDRVAAVRGESPTEGYRTVDVRAGWAPGHGVNVRFGVENLFDELYVNHLNSTNPYTGQPVPEPGRVLFLDVGWTF